MSQADIITLVIIIPIVTIGIYFFWRRAHFLHQEYLLYLSEKIPMQIVEPSRLLPAIKQEKRQVEESELPPQEFQPDTKKKMRKEEEIALPLFFQPHTCIKSLPENDPEPTFIQEPNQDIQIEAELFPEKISSSYANWISEEQSSNQDVNNPEIHMLPKKDEQQEKACSVIIPTRKSHWTLPKISLLHEAETVKSPRKDEEAKSLAKIIQDTLHSFNIDAEARSEDISIGPTIIRFGIRPTGKPAMRRDEKTGKMVPIVDGSGQIVYGTRTRVSRIMALQNDLALALEAKTIRMEAPVPGHPYVGVEIPNKHSRLVTLREVLESKEHQAVEEKSKLAIGLGKDVAGKVRVGDLARMPHLLIAGATGAGKSVCINTIIASILTQATPDDVRLLMVDPKMVELNMYNGIPHLLSPVVTEVDKVVSLLRNAINEMERRYRLFSQLGVRNLDGYRKLRQEKFQEGDSSLNNLPAIVIIIDELADLMMAAPEEVEGMICRLAQLARATGIHLVVATQRPSVDVITGLIKANIPTRISFMVSSNVDSRTIIDMGGAERLLGRGDMLYLPADAGRPERIQGAFLSDEEANMLAEYWRKQIIEHAAIIGKIQPEPVAEEGWELKDQPTVESELEDDLLDRAEEIVRENGRASISLLQRRLRIGYTRAARLIDVLEQRHIIGQSESAGRGRVVYDDNQENEESQDLFPEEILEPDISLDELSMLNPDKYFQSLGDMLRRTANYANSHGGIIIKESNTTTTGLRATSTDSEELRKEERVSAEEWVHAFQYDSGIFWQLNILLRDEKGRTQLHPEHEEKLNQWRKE